MTDFRDLSRRVAKIEREDAEQTAAEWAEEFADQQISEVDRWEIVDSDEDVEDDHEGILITTIGNEYYAADIRAHPEEIPDRFDADEDFPV